MCALQSSAALEVMQQKTCVLDTVSLSKSSREIAAPLDVYANIQKLWLRTRQKGYPLYIIRNSAKTIPKCTFLGPSQVRCLERREVKNFLIFALALVVYSTFKYYAY